MFCFSKLKRSICSLAALCVLLGALPADSVQAASSSEIQEQIDQLQDKREEVQAQIDFLEALIKENATELADMIENKKSIDTQCNLLNAQIDAARTELAVLTDLIADTQQELDTAKDNYQELNGRYKDRIRVMEEQGNLTYWSVLFRSNSFSEFLDRMAMVEEIAKADQVRLEQLNAAKQEVELLQMVLQNRKLAHRETMGQLETLLETLEEKQAQAEQIIRQLLEKGAEYDMLLEESEQTQEELMQQLAQKEIEFDEAAYREWLESQPPVQTPGDEPEEELPEDNKGEHEGIRWLTPLRSYTLSSPFGNRFHPILNIWRMHNGIDMAAPAGTEIYAARDGVVITAAYQPDGAGNYVQLDHADGYRSIYMHMTRYIVKPGDFVRAGQVIGYVGNTGLSKGNHLHFGISYQGKYVNPLEYID